MKIRHSVIALLLWLTAGTVSAFAQSSPNLIYGQVPTAAQWNSYFAHKQDVLGFTPVNKAGDVMTGRFITAAPTISAAGLNLPPGTAPLTPVNGDLWTTTSGIYVRINGATVGPLTSAATPCTFCALTNVANVFTLIQTVNLNAASLPAALTGSVLNLGGTDATSARLQLNAFGAQAFFTTAAYGGTNASPTAVTSGTQIGGFNAYAYNGSALVGPIASFRAYAAQNISAGNQGSRACIGTTAIGGTSIADSFCQYTNGFVNISVTAPTAIPGGLLTVNLNTAASASAPFAGIHVVSSDGGVAGVTLEGFGASPVFAGRRTGGTNAARTGANGVLISMLGQGYNLSTYATGGVINITASETWTATANGTGIFFATTPNGTTTITTVFALLPSGGVTLGAATDKGAGTLNAPTLIYVNGNAVAISAASPLVLNATTGALTCPTCATTAGASIPALATGDILYASAANVLSALSDIATGNALITGGVGVAPSYGKIGLTTHISGVLGIVNGGTNASSASGTSLDNITGFSSTGILARTAAGTYAFRTITGTSNRITITNGDGVAGVPTIDVSTSYVGQATITTLGTIATGTWQGTKVGLAFGGTNADLSATGGTSQVLKQVSTGATITVGQLACSDLSGVGTGCSAAAGITALTGDVTATGPGSVAATLATVNSNVGTFGSATQSVQFTVNGKGLMTAAANVTITPAISNVTGLGTGCATWLATPSSANLATCVTDESGSGALVFANSATMDSPTFTTLATVSNGRFAVSGSITTTSPAFDVSSTITTSTASLAGFSVRPTFVGSGDGVRGVSADPVFTPSGNLAAVYGLVLIPRVGPAAGITVTSIYGIYSAVLFQNTGGAVTNGYGIYLEAPAVSASIKPVTQYGAYVANQGASGITTSYAIYVQAQSGATNSYGIYSLENITMGTAAKTLVLKEGSNGATGTFVCTSGGTITISNTFIAITDKIVISLNTVGGTISTPPATKAITAGTSFQVLCATLDTSTYNYGIIKSAAWLMERDLKPANDNHAPAWFSNRSVA